MIKVFLNGSLQGLKERTHDSLLFFMVTFSQFVFAITFLFSSTKIYLKLVGGKKKYNNRSDMKMINSLMSLKDFQNGIIF